MLPRIRRFFQLTRSKMHISICRRPDCALGLRPLWMRAHYDFFIVVPAVPAWYQIPTIISQNTSSKRYMKYRADTVADQWPRWQKASRYITQNMLNRSTAPYCVLRSIHQEWTEMKNSKNVNPERLLSFNTRIAHTGEIFQNRDIVLSKSGERSLIAPTLRGS